MFNLIKTKMQEWYYLRHIDKNELEYFYKILAISIYIDKEIDENELIIAKKDLKNFIFSHYKILKEEQKKFIIDFLYKKILEELKKYKESNTYFEEQKNRIINYILSLKTTDYLLKYIKDIIIADKKIVKEEKNFLFYLEKHIENTQDLTRK